MSDLTPPMAEIDRIERELRAGLEGVTPGPYEVSTCADVWVEVNDKGIAQCGDISWLKADSTINDQREMEANARHFARCSPENIRLLLDELSRLRSREEEYRKALEEIIRKGRTTGYGKPALVTVAVRALDPTPSGVKSQ